MSTLARSHLLPSFLDDRAAIIIPGDPALTISQSGFVEQCDAIQKQLCSLGLGTGMAVSIILPNSLEFAVVFLAIAWQRCIAAPLNPAYKEEEVEFYISDIDAAAIIVSKNAYEQKVPAVRAATKRNAGVIECWTDEEGRVVFDVKARGRLEDRRDKPLEKAQEDDIGLILHTSGTTGKPKAVLSTSGPDSSGD
ncbi:MAG: hypothetical protein HETSPECPRED_008453 [Heterodermia speciosa]|uniref:AMP-dependent synthetase/ligase domain-containing protein n=1 Tax=Heterodermia speciosa TaxID=116794 RepID=A0A8H3ILV2_9LECA|nr:MAG: hypothetical protein HETSPECPRED_008453 [Heterodermia speciosa]